jgi:hypothetical protein
MGLYPEDFFAKGRDNENPGSKNIIFSNVHRTEKAFSQIPCVNFGHTCTSSRAIGVYIRQPRSSIVKVTNRGNSDTANRQQHNQ